MNAGQNKTSVFLLFVLVLPVFSQTQGPQQAEWIAPSSPSQPNQWYCFREEVHLENPPQKATAQVACDSKYWLWINGDMVIFEGQLKRGPTPEDTYFDEIDLTDHLRQGRNTIAVLVWYWGKHGFSHNSSGQMGLLFECSVDGRVFCSDTSWKVNQHPAYGSTEGPHPNFRLAESNILFDARKDIGKWYQGGFDDSRWSAAAAFGKPPAAPWNRLEKRPIPFWKNAGLRDYESVSIRRHADGTKTVIGKLPYNCHLTPYLKVQSPEGKKIDIRTDNYMGGGCPNVRAVYITRSGVQEYESFGWMNGHEVCYTMPEDVEVLSIQYRETGYAADFAGFFACDDAALNTLWEKAERTLYVTMRDNFMDCPDRERAQWWGDAVIELGEAFYVFDSQKGPLLTKKAIYELARWQRPDNVLYSPVPAGISRWRGKAKEMLTGQWEEDGTWNWELPQQMLASVGWYGFWRYYWYSGDRQTLIDVYPHVRNYLALWQFDRSGLVIHRAGDWDWADWGENQDVPVLENAWVYLALKAAAETAKLIGNQADAADYQAKMNSIKANFNNLFWNGEAYRSSSFHGQTDDRAQGLAVVAGLACPEYYPAIRKVLQTHYHASPYMEKYVLESLYQMGAPQEAIERMKKRWAVQIESPLTTLWEGWGIGPEGYGGGTYNHAWSGGPLTLLSEYGAGIAPTRPGFEEFSVMPQMGPLKRIQADVPTPYGTIRLKLQRSEQLQMELTVPSKTTAIVGIPKVPSPSMIQINKEIVYQDGRPSSAQYTGEDERWIKFCLPEGRFHLTSRN